MNFMSSSDNSEWKLHVNFKKTKALALAAENTYLLGKHTWRIMNDSVRCEHGRNHTLELKMSGCTDGEFTCGNGECVMMEDRCDQVLDCQDESDEVDCQTMVLKESYRKTAPPVTLGESKTKTVVPTSVDVTMTLLDISDVRESQNEIHIKFVLELQWKETRAVFYNLKKAMSHNNLIQDDIDRLWTPKLIYRNNKDNFNTRQALTESTVKIERKGNFTRSGLDVLDEIEMFSGKDNPIVMTQSYTKEFKCVYNLEAFPFDTQVYKGT